MTMPKKILVLLLTLMLLVLSASLPLAASAAGYSVKDLTLQPGTDETAMNFCWYSTGGSGASYVQLAEASAMQGTGFPAAALSFQGSHSPASDGNDTNKVTATGLRPNTAYVYRVGDGSRFGDVYRFSTRDSANYTALFISDAQIGASGSASRDETSWERTLASASASFPNASFLLSAGDQVDYAPSEGQYDLFFSPSLLRTLPLAPTAGNHETFESSPNHLNHFDVPNESAMGRTSAGGDYWFRYGYTLYLVLNSNNPDCTQHDAFLGDALAFNPDITWTVLMFHHSLYSSADHASDTYVKNLRKNLTPVIDKYHIDLVLSGHDHTYTRTYQMQGGSPLKNQTVDAQGRVVNPTGTLYVTAETATGSKYYDLQSEPESYAAIRLQPETPMFSALTVTGNTLSIATYRADTKAMLDSYTILKETSSGFVDVPDSAWYSPAVKFAASRGITTGTGNYHFSPNSILTRGQFVVFLMRAYSLTPDSGSADNFSDAGNTYYTGYLAAAKHLGIAQGTGGNQFSPENSITRQDMFTLLYNALTVLQKVPSGTVTRSYSDIAALAPYAVTAVNRLTACGIITGSGGQLDPLGKSTRAQMVQVLYKLLAG